MSIPKIKLSIKAVIKHFIKAVSLEYYSMNMILSSK